MTKPDSAFRSPTSPIVWTILGLLTVFVYFYGLNLPFLGPDEARYAQVGREMLDNGDWVTPTLGGFTWFEKPALLYWLEIAFFKIFGVNEFAARFGPALFGLGTVVSLWILGKNLATESSENSKIAGKREDFSKISVPSVANDFPKYLAVIAASTLGILVFSRGASFDIVITFPITAALVSFFIFDRACEKSGNPVAIAPGSDHASQAANSTTATATATAAATATATVPAPLIFFYVFIGVALIAKGLIGIVFPFAIVAFYYVLSRRIPNWRFLLSLIWGTMLAVAVAAIWYWPVYHQNGYAFIEQFIIEHHFQRFTSNKYQHPQPFYFFLWVLPLMTLPWMPLFFAAIWSFTRRFFRPISRSHFLTFSPSPLLRFAAAWILVPLVFFSFSGSKLPGYILPAVPGAIVLTSLFVFELVQKSHKWRIAVLSTAAAMLATTAILLTFAVPKFAESDSVRSLMDAANTAGYTSNRVLSLHTTSHNAEFYAAGRLLRDETGKQRRLSGISEVTAEIEAENGKPVLVLVPLEYLSQLRKDEKIDTKILKDNGELAITLVSIK